MRTLTFLLSTLITISILTLNTLGANIKCPVTTCHETLKKDRCLELDYEFPYEQTLRIGKCTGNRVCNYGRKEEEKEMLWPAKPNEMMSRKDISGKQLWGYCVDAKNWEVGYLLPGRSCSNDYQCSSNLCLNGKC